MISTHNQNRRPRLAPRASATTPPDEARTSEAVETAAVEAAVAKPKAAAEVSANNLEVEAAKKATKEEEHLAKSS